ncbi:hypothetical protein DFH07DRAFT_772416 [Mycena maculata]|uniref:Uncharacterized protein n=1 Tax=Mycena maculata TaxID=230809 RepID=A0AAD7NFI7_9AGAR|nr:hypothetical protein DFH07DRAFT_772416 [Mycena maculata]
MSFTLPRFSGIYFDPLRRLPHPVLPQVALLLPLLPQAALLLPVLPKAAPLPLPVLPQVALLLLLPAPLLQLVALLLTMQRLPMITPAVVSFNTNRSPSPALSALTEMSYGSMTSIESEEPTLPPKPRQRRWDINSTALIGTPAKAPTKANVGALLKELYDLETTKAVDEKYTKFRLAIDTIAKRTLASGTFTQQNPDKVQQLYNELSKVYPWFSRCVDGWAARPYLLERQRNTMKRHAIKQEVKVGREAKKVLGSLRRTHSGSHKQATLLIMRKTRSFNPASGSQ